jgi:hypothetical protein
MPVSQLFTGPADYLSLWTRRAGFYRVNILGTIQTGQLNFLLNTFSGTPAAASLWNNATMALVTNATTTGTYYWWPQQGQDGFLQVQASSNFSGNAYVVLEDASEDPKPCVGVNVLPSAARTAFAKGPWMNCGPYKGATIYLNVTAASGTGGLNVNFFGYYNGGIALFPSTITTAGNNTVVVSPYGTNRWGGSNLYSAQIPDTFYMQVYPADNSSYTYSLIMDFTL